MTDQLQRFIFEDTDIRGELTQLKQSYLDILTAHQYPEVVSRLLGEFIAAATLLSATLKFEGTLTLQARSEGEIPLIMAEATSDHTVRAIARAAENACSEDFNQLLADGNLSIIIDPKKGKRYQGVVGLSGASLSESLEMYFLQSEQLSTRIWLASDRDRAAGFMLQELPASQNIDPQQREQSWQHITSLTETITRQELLTLPFEQLLHRLYHQEPLRIFNPDPVRFNCSCSRARTGSALRSLGQAELKQIIAEHGAVDINCEFCHQHYHFDQQAIEALFQQTLH